MINGQTPVYRNSLTAAASGAGYVKAEGANSKGKKFANFHYFVPCGDHLVLISVAETRNGDSFQPDSIPFFLMTGTASGEVMYLTSALAASGCDAPVAMPPENTVTAWISAGNGPM